MGNPRDWLRRLVHRCLWSRRLVYGLRPQARLRSVCGVSHCAGDCGAGLGRGSDRPVVKTNDSEYAPRLPRDAKEEPPTQPGGSSPSLSGYLSTTCFTDPMLGSNV